ncbi:MAG: GNAT family N-acetyltransferase [Minwuia sp.]|uniref:GNAT family N-acetyltransferase n=1 Tax=Minwuia sp. TaxID=2493630 RepID=UPI003A87BCFE
MSGGEDDLPERTIPVTITYLRMDQQPGRNPPPAPAIPHAVMRAEKPTVHFYRYLYNTVGERWVWTERRYMPDEELGEIVRDPDVEIMVLYVRGVPAGYAELDFRGLPETADLAYFGMMPDFIGMKLGPWFLHWAVSELWSRTPHAVTVNTCTADHPAALPMYQRMGFSPIRREEAMLRPMPA